MKVLINENIEEKFVFLQVFLLLRRNNNVRLHGETPLQLFILLWLFDPLSLVSTKRAYTLKQTWSIQLTCLRVWFGNVSKHLLKGASRKSEEMFKHFLFNKIFRLA